MTHSMEITTKENDSPQPLGYSVVLESTGDTPQQIADTATRILSTLEELNIKPTRIVAAIHIHSMREEYDQAYVAAVQKIQARIGPLEIRAVDKDGQWSHAYSYLRPIFEIAQSTSKPHGIIEIDGGGGHLPEEIGRFAMGLSRHHAVFSTRFSESGKHLGPLQRRAVSFFGTLGGNVLTIPPARYLRRAQWGKASDMTSGYEGFMNLMLRDMFEIIPIEEFVCVKAGAPFHMYQTEMRAYILALLSARGQLSAVQEVPITYGQEKKVGKLGWVYVYNSALSMWAIRQNVARIFNHVLTTDLQSR